MKKKISQYELGYRRAEVLSKIEIDHLNERINSLRFAIKLLNRQIKRETNRTEISYVQE